MTNRYRSMDLLRAIAILLVILAHTVLSYGAPENLAPLQFGGTGVDLFFVLSGWLLGSQLFKELKSTDSINVKRFWYRRWLRTLPAYYAVLIFSTAQRLLTKDNVDFPTEYFFFVQNYDYPLHFFSISWSLCVEEQFYLFIAPLIVTLAFSQRLALPIILSSLLLLPTYFREAGMFSNIHETHVAIDGCILGVLLAYTYHYYREFWLKFRPLAFPMAAIALFAYIFFYYARYNPHLGITDPDRLFLVLMFGSWIVLANSSEQWRARLYVPGSNFIATRAYSLYLLHPEVLALLRRFVPDIPFVAYLLLALVGSIIVANILYRFVEKPIMDLRDNISSLK